MNAKQDETLRYAAFFTVDGVAAPGLTVTVDITEPGAGLLVTDAAAADEGGGWYSYEMAGGLNDADGMYLANFKTADASVDQQNLPAGWVVGTTALADAAEIDGGTPLTTIRNYVWNATQSNYVSAGTTGEKQNLSGSGEGGGGVLTSIVASAVNTLTGTNVSGDVTSLSAEDGNEYISNFSAGDAISVVVDFNMPNLEPTELLVNGRVTSNHQNGDSYADIQAYNYTDAAWDTISTPATRLNNTELNTTSLIGLSANHVDGSGNAQIRFDGSHTGTGDSTIYLDRVIVGAVLAGTTILTASDIAEAVWNQGLSVLYDNMVYLDTENGQDGDDLGSYGTASFPVQTLTKALQIAKSVGTGTIHVVRGSTVVLDQSIFGMNLVNEMASGENRWVLDTNGFDISKCIFVGAQAYGNYLSGTGSATFVSCELYGISGPSAGFTHCVMGKKTAITGGDYVVFNGCAASLMEADGGNIDLSSAISAIDVYVLNHQGALSFDGMSGSDAAEIAGTGVLTFRNTCTGGAAKTEGFWELVDSSGGAVTVYNEATYNRTTHIGQSWDTHTPRALTETVDIGAVTGTPVTNVDDFKADVSALATTAQADVIQAQTDKIPANPTDQSDLADMALESTLQLVKTAVDKLPDNPVDVTDIPTVQEIASQVYNSSAFDFEDTAQALSITDLILSLLNAKIDGVTGDIIAYKQNDLVEFSRHTAQYDSAAEPITAVGV